MNTIDKVLLEWSLKTDKGYPDLNSKEDMDLFESMFGIRLNEEQTSTDGVNYDINYSTASKNVDIEDIVKLLKKETGNQKLLQRVYRTLSSNTSVDKVKSMLNKVGITKDTFSNRNLPAEIIRILIRGKSNDVQTFLNSINSTNLQSSGNVKTTGLPGFPEEKYQALAGLHGAKNGVAMGKGEVMFPILYNNVELITNGAAGDFKVNEKPGELKSNDSRLAGDSIRNPLYTPINAVEKTSWGKSLRGDMVLGRKEGNIDRVVANMNKFIKDTYPKSEIKATKEDKDPAITMAKAAIDAYIKRKNIFTYILFDHKSGDYRTFTPATGILKAIDAGEVKFDIQASPQLKGFST
tara:strand:- start:3 stop:1055 length:1053 start_codon:yes stop_codon:yes gene_type:complete